MKCPGQDTQYWTAGSIFEVNCPRCNHGVEFFKDDTTRKCANCGHRFVNPKMDFGCAAYCQYAEQCLGDLPPELVAQQENLLKDRVAVAVKRHLKTDFKRIGRISRRVRHAEEMAQNQPVILPVLMIAAYLWGLDDTGRAELPVARGILSDLNVPPPLVEEICKVIGEHNGSDGETAAAAHALLLEADLRATLEAAGKTN